MVPVSSCCTIIASLFVEMSSMYSFVSSLTGAGFVVVLPFLTFALMKIVKYPSLVRMPSYVPSDRSVKVTLPFWSVTPRFKCLFGT